MNEEAIGKIVIARYASGDVVAVGEVVGYQDRPTFVIRKPDGSKGCWVASLCELVNAECPECHGRGYVLPEPTGNLSRDWALVVCPLCAEDRSPAPNQAEWL